MTITYNEQECNIDFACPYSGDNYATYKNDISVLEIEQKPPVVERSGHPIFVNYYIRNKPIH